MARTRVILGSVGVVSALGVASGYAWLTSAAAPQPPAARRRGSTPPAHGTSLGHLAESRPGAPASRPVRPRVRPIEDVSWQLDEAV